MMEIIYCVTPTLSTCKTHCDLHVKLYAIFSLLLLLLSDHSLDALVFTVLRYFQKAAV